MDVLNEKYFAETCEAVKNLVDIKRALHAHDVILDDKTDLFKSNIGQVSGSIQALHEENVNIERFLAENTQTTEPSVHNIDSLVRPANAMTEKLISL